MSEQLWSDERIDVVFDLDRRDIYEITMVEHDDAKRVLREMRDEYEQRIADLEAENSRVRDDYFALQSWCRTVEEHLQADINQQKEDMAEMERLRALLPGLEVLRAIRDLADDAVKMSDDYHAGDELDLNAIHHWLYKLSDRVDQLERAQREGQGEL